MKNSVFNKCFTNSKYLVIMSAIVFYTSCEEEIEEITAPSQNFGFQEYIFTENIECYDTLGNRLDSLSYMYSQNDFIYTDEFEIPYDKIVIKPDSTLEMHYTADNLPYQKYGKVSFKNDTLHFYSDLNLDYPLFSGIMIDNQLNIPGFGYIFYNFSSNGFINVTEEDKSVQLGIPDMEHLLKEFPSPSLGYYTHKTQIFYIQKFDLVYEIISK